MKTSLLARSGMVMAAAGLVIFLLGIFPGLLHLDATPGTGLLQIVTLLMGITVMTLGASVYMYAVRHRALPTRLREDVGVRLMATGVVLAYASGLADILGIGSHYGSESPLFGTLQALGVAGGVLVIVVGMVLYAWPRSS